MDLGFKSDRNICGIWCDWSNGNAVCRTDDILAEDSYG